MNSRDHHKEVEQKHQVVLQGTQLTIGAGWVDIVDLALDEFATLDIPNLSVTTVKEKFGALRIYAMGDRTASDWPKVQDIIGRAVEASITTCEVCGDTDDVDVIMEGGWLRARCPIHTNHASNGVDRG